MNNQLTDDRLHWLYNIATELAVSKLNITMKPEDIFLLTAELQERRKADSTEPVIPETLPCPVLLEPGLRFGKGVPTKTMLKALQRRTEYCGKLDHLTSKERASDDANTTALKTILKQPVTISIPDEIPDEAYEVLSKAMGDKACLIADELWNACRYAMLEGYSR